MSELLGIDSVFALSDPLVEDIELGLCGTFRHIWDVVRIRFVTGFIPVAESTTFSRLMTQLRAWRARLETMSLLVGQQPYNTKDTQLRFLLDAYRGKESRDDPERDQVTLGRIISLITDAKLLHCLLLSVLVGEEPESVEKYVDSDTCRCVKAMWKRLFLAVSKSDQCKLNP